MTTRSNFKVIHYMNTKNSKKMTRFFNINNTVFSALTLVLLSSFSFSSLGASLTTYRIYLDNNNRTESFIIFAKGNVPEKCSLKLRHFNFDDVGNMTVPEDESVPDNSSVPWIRFSPKHFTVQPRTPQSIRFTMRRKPNTEANEYRSYLAVSCKGVKENVQKESTPGRPSVTVQPRLVQNIPIIVRTGPLQATAQFEDITIKGGTVSASLTRQGERSIYGRLSLFNNKTDKELTFTSGISLYPETTTFKFNLSIKAEDMPKIEDLTLKFVEDENYGGSLIIEKSLK